MKARAPYRCEAFDCEPAEMYGSISAVDTLAGAVLRFIGWDCTGAVAWDTANQTPVNATVVVTDPEACAYAAVVAPLPAIYTPRPAKKEYKWEVRRVDDLGQPVLVWGYLTVTPTPSDES